MAQLVISAAGAALGFMVGGPQGALLGWSLGSALGGSFAKPTQGQQQSLMDLTVTGTAYGQAIPYIRGAATVAGQVWWNTDRRPVTTTTTTGGKGGGGGVSTSTISYNMDMLVGLSDNPIVGVGRIWLNGALIYTADSAATDGSLAASIATTQWSRLTVYPGSDTQLPDPTYEAAVGIGAAPAYRGRGYVFIEGLQLGQSGQVPNLTFEVIESGAVRGKAYAAIDPLTYLPSVPYSGVSLQYYPWLLPQPAWAEPNSSLTYQGQWGNPDPQFWGFTPSVFKSASGVDRKLYCEFHLMYGGCGLCTDQWRAQNQPGYDGGTGDIRFGRDDQSIGFSFNQTYYPPFGPAGTTVTRSGGIATQYSSASIGGLQHCGMLVDFDALTVELWIGGVPAGTVHCPELANGNWGPAPQLAPYTGSGYATIIADPLYFSYTPPAGYGPWIRGAATIAKAPPTLASVVSALCVRAGLSVNQIDVAALSAITRPVRCMAVSQIVNMRSVIELLESAYFFEMTVSDKIYFRPRGGASVATIPYLDLGATKGTDSPEPLALLQANELEIPAQVALTYINIDNDYQPDTQYSDRLISAAGGTLNALSMALGMSAADAKAIADSILLDTATSVLSSTIQVLGDYCRLEPTDVVTLTGQDGAMFRARLVKKTDAYPLLTFDAVLDDASALIETGITSADYTSSTVVVPVAGTVMTLMDVPILQDSDNDAGFYVATKGDSALYPGSAVFNSVDDVTYVRKATVLESAVFGWCTTTLGDWTRGRMFDETNTVTVNVGLGSLASDTRDNVLHDLAVNAMLVGSEMIQFRTATITAPGVYVLSGLLRGGRGTEWATTGHVANERCVLLRAAGLRRVLMLNTDLGLSRFYKGVTLGQPLSSAVAVSFTDIAIGLKPFSPILFKAGRDAANNVIFEWQRRTRLAVRMIGPLGINVPLGEDTESYEIDIFSGSSYSTVVRTIASSTPTAPYTEAQQIADGLTPGNTIYARVYQRSATVGRGYPLQQAA